MTAPVLRVNKLTTSFKTVAGFFPAVDNVSFEVRKGETLGIVGESGSGKSVTVLSIMGLLSTGKNALVHGEVLLHGNNLLAMRHRELQKIRGKSLGMIFQEPMTSLNPIFTIGDQIGEVLRIHENLSRTAAKKKTLEILDLVKIPAAAQRYREYPFQLSGGMRQRVMIGMALACKPEILIADEPTTALDVTIQAQILELLSELQQELGMAILLITHDLGVVAETCNEVLVMYGGRIVERAPANEIFSNARHPYTKGLLAATPRLGQRRPRLQTIPGMVPSLGHFPKGCYYQDRCPLAIDQCRGEEPPLIKTGSVHYSRCYRNMDVNQMENS